MQIKRETAAIAGRFDLLVQCVTDYAIYMLDPDGIVTSWNAGAERFKGYAPDEIIGEHFSRFYGEEDNAAGVPAYRRPRCGRPLWKGALRRKVGACARTGRASGQMWSLILCEPPMGT